MLRVVLSSRLEDLKYSNTTLKLTRQHLLERRGRWGDRSGLWYSRKERFERDLFDGGSQQVFGSPSASISGGVKRRLGRLKLL